MVHIAILSAGIGIVAGIFLIFINGSKPIPEKLKFTDEKGDIDAQKKKNDDFQEPKQPDSNSSEKKGKNSGSKKKNNKKADNN